MAQLMKSMITIVERATPLPVLLQDSQLFDDRAVKTALNNQLMQSICVHDCRCYAESQLENASFGAWHPTMQSCCEMKGAISWHHSAATLQKHAQRVDLSCSSGFELHMSV